MQAGTITNLYPKLKVEKYFYFFTLFFILSLNVSIFTIFYIPGCLRDFISLIMNPMKVRAVTKQAVIAKCIKAVSSYCKLSLLSSLLKKNDILTRNLL